MTDGLFLKIDNEKLEQVNFTKFLGVFIDSHLTWENHIEHCKSKVSSGIYALNMSKHVLKQSHLKILYYSLIHSHLTYGLILWGNALQKYISKLERVQKKAIRAIRAITKAPTAYSEIMRRSFLYKGPSLWLTLADPIKSSKTVFTFQLLINNYDNFMLSCIVMFDVPTC